jgi:hypothetical protein
MFDDNDNKPDDHFEEHLEKLIHTWWPAAASLLLLVASIWGWYEARDEDLLICRGNADCHQAAMSREVMMGVFIVAAFVALVVTLITAWHKALPPEE